MASSYTNFDDEDRPSEKSFDQIVIATHKIKYINPNFKKVKLKMYDYKCDVKLRVGNSNFKAHKEVLSDASDYFSAMFSHDMLEKEQEVINLLDTSPTGFALILDYLYHGHVTIDPDTAEDVLEGARFFQVDWLVEVCCDYLIHQLSIDNYQSVLHLADKYWLGDLRGDIFHFLGLHITELSKEKHFYQNFDLELLMQFLREDVYVEAEEEFILQLVIKWVESSKEERRQYLLPLLRLVRFSLMDIDSLERLPEDLLQWPEIQDSVEEGKYYNNSIPAQGLCEGQRFLPRGSQPNVIMFRYSFEASTLMYVDVVTDYHWQEELMSTEAESRFESSTTAKVGNFLYSAGGYDDEVCSSDQVFRYNPRFRDWTRLASLNQPRVSHAMCHAGDKVFAVGGILHTIGETGDEDHILSSVEMYDIRENVWTHKTNLPTGSYNQATAFCDGVLYVSGGISDDPTDSVPMRSLWAFNLADEAWSARQDMLYARQGHSMTTLKDKLYVFGGYTTRDGALRGGQVFRDCYKSEVYSVETYQWTEIRDIPDTFGHVMRTVGLWGDRFFLFAGGHLHSYYVDEDRMEYGDYIGSGVQKIAVLDVAYPPGC